MRRFLFSMAGALTAVAFGASTGFAQSNELNSFGAYPTPQPYGQAPGSYVVAPSLPGSGGTYGYVQQNFGPAAGMSPNAYYSANYFTGTPMTSPNRYYHRPGYAGTTAVPAGTTYNSAYVAPNRGYYTAYPSNYYGVRRGGPLRRLFGR